MNKKKRKFVLSHIRLYTLLQLYLYNWADHIRHGTFVILHAHKSPKCNTFLSALKIRWYAIFCLYERRKKTPFQYSNQSLRQKILTNHAYPHAHTRKGGNMISGKYGRRKIIIIHARKNRVN